MIHVICIGRTFIVGRGNLREHVNRTKNETLKYLKNAVKKFVLYVTLVDDVGLDIYINIEKFDF